MRPPGREREPYDATPQVWPLITEEAAFDRFVVEAQRELAAAPVASEGRPAASHAPRLMALLANVHCGAATTTTRRPGTQGHR